MAHDPNEASDFVGISAALLVNIGTMGARGARGDGDDGGGRGVLLGFRRAGGAWERGGHPARLDHGVKQAWTRCPEHDETWQFS